jgi:hypothetical protein
VPLLLHDQRVVSVGRRVSTWPSALTAVAMASTVHVPAAALSRNTFAEIEAARHAPGATCSDDVNHPWQLAAVVSVAASLWRRSRLSVVRMSSSAGTWSRPGSSRVGAALRRLYDAP